MNKAKVYDLHICYYFEKTNVVYMTNIGVLKQMRIGNYDNTNRRNKFVGYA